MSKQRLPVALFGPYPPPAGGVATYMASLHYWLQYFGCEVRQFAYHGGHQQERRANVLPGFYSILREFFPVTRSSHWIDSASFYIEYPHIRSFVAWSLLRKLRCWNWTKVIHDGTLPERFQAMPIIQRSVCLLAIRSVDKFIVVSPELEEWLRSHGTTAPIHVIPSLLPLPDDVRHPRLKPEINKRLPDAAFVCCIGTFALNYGFEEVVRAVEILRNKGCPLQLVLINAGFDEQDNGKASLAAGRGWIRIFNNLPRDQVLGIIKKSVVMVRAYTSESYGLSRIEALWMGTPVIATAAGEQQGMHIYQAGDSDALVRLIRQVIDNTDKQSIDYWAKFYRKHSWGNLRHIFAVVSET